MAFYNRGNIYAMSKNYDQAIANFDSAIKLDPQYATALYWRGKAKQRKGDASGGNVDVSAAEKIDPNVAARH